jgi:hypothetical protein
MQIPVPVLLFPKAASLTHFVYVQAVMQKLGGYRKFILRSKDLGKRMVPIPVLIYIMFPIIAQIVSISNSRIKANKVQFKKTN